MENRGIFLVHTWKFSEKERQTADIAIRLQEHIDAPFRTSLLKERQVECVNYELGRNFSEVPIVKSNSEDNFALEISA